MARRKLRFISLGLLAVLLVGAGGDNGRITKTAEAATETPAAMTTRKGRRTRRQFGMTAADFVLALVKQQTKPTTREINTHWKGAGRPFTADVPLGKLVKEKKLKRTPLVGERGSRYSVA
jgi:hypothetical protein